MSTVRTLLLHNWHLKTFAVLLSFILWATFTSEPADEVGYLVPLEFRNLPDSLEIAGDVPAQIYVRVRGRASLLRRVSARDFAVPIDLAGSPAGERSIPITDAEVDEPLGTQIVRISPSSLRLKLVERRPH